jgi:cytidine deaminase
MKTIPEDQIHELAKVARRFRTKAYAPYSAYKVGAAVLGRNGKIYGGCNVENASYGLTVCAERVALGAAVTDGERKPLAIAVATGDPDPATPCGACRQFLVEFNPNMEVILVGSGKRLKRCLAKDLLPGFFVLKGRRTGKKP